MTGHKIKEIAAALSAPFAGDGDLIIKGAREPGEAGSEHLAVAMTQKYGDDLEKCNARAAVLWQGADWQAFGLQAAIFVNRPRLAMATLTNFLVSVARSSGDVHGTAVIDPKAIIGDNCLIGPFVVIGSDAKIGSGARIQANTTIGNQVSIGRNCTLGAGVVIADNVRIGDGLVAHPGVVIGADGFSFVTAEPSPAESRHKDRSDATVGLPGQKLQKIHSLGGVVIGNDVEIGANSSIDAGTIRATNIGDGTKVDALVQVGHNVRIGKNCLLCAHVAVGGSATIGDGVVLGGQAGVADNIKIGDGVIAGGASKILSNVKAGRVILGYPAVAMDKHIQGYRALYRLPRLLRNFAGDKKSVPTGDSKD